MRMSILCFYTTLNQTNKTSLFPVQRLIIIVLITRPRCSNKISLSSISCTNFVLKDAMSVSLYPYNQSQILQNVKYTKKINIAKGFAIVTNSVFMDKK